MRRMFNVIFGKRIPVSKDVMKEAEAGRSATYDLIRLLFALDIARISLTDFQWKVGSYIYNRYEDRNK